MPIELTYECPKCHTVGSAGRIEPSGSAACRHCAAALTFRPASFEGGGLVACPVCATDDLYVQKDFPQGLGLAIVILGFAASTVFWYQDRPVPALGILLVSALVDMALFYVVPDVTICYRCLSQCRGDGANPGGRFKAFDLPLGERYRQERLRIEELKARDAAGGSSSPAAP